MTLARPNMETRFVGAIRALLPAPAQQFVFMDIGARDGMSKYWQPFAGLAEFIGFEPEPVECARLNARYQKAGDQRSRVYPLALAGTSGRQLFYETQFNQSSGLLRGNDAWLSRFPWTTLKVKREGEVDAVTLDRFCAETPLHHVDFIKIDVEGSEYDILHGARETLARQHVLGVLTEIWWDPVMKGQRSFADLDALLRGAGFRFFDLQFVRYARATLPAGRLYLGLDPEGKKAVVPAIDREYGQASPGDALYFRDPVGELKAGALDPHWDTYSLLRLCALLDAFDYGDCVLEILEAFYDTLLADIDVDTLMDAAVPLVDGDQVNYDVYRGASIGIRQRENQQVYKLTDWEPPPSNYGKRRAGS